MLDVSVVADPNEFAELAGPLLAAQPVDHTLISSVLHDVLSDPHVHPDAQWVAVAAEGTVVGLAMWTPPWPPYLGPMPDDAAVAVADALAHATAEPPGINGEANAVRRAVERYRQIRPSVTVEVTTRVRLHQLGELTPPDVPGSARVATQSDRDLIRTWTRGYAGDVHQPAEQVMQWLRVRLDQRSLMLWEVDGTPVSMAGHTPPAAGVSRVGPVYTPEAHRRHGYAAAVTAEVSRRARTQGVVAVVLFTDLGNPTSNKIYSEIGYRPVRDYLEVSFGR